MWAAAGYGTHAQSRCAHRDTGEGRWQPLRDGSDSRLTEGEGAEQGRGRGSSRGSRLARPQGPACPPQKPSLPRTAEAESRVPAQPREDAPSPGGRAAQLSRGGLTGWAVVAAMDTLSVALQTRETASGLCLRDSAEWGGRGRCSGLKRNGGKSLRSPGFLCNPEGADASD